MASNNEEYQISGENDGGVSINHKHSMKTRSRLA